MIIVMLLENISIHYNKVYNVKIVILVVENVMAQLKMIASNVLLITYLINQHKLVINYVMMLILSMIQQQIHA